MREELPLVVDLDGTLIKSDMLLETLVGVLRRLPWLVVLIPVWLLRGRAGLKRELADRAILAPDRLPYREEVLSWVREERSRGRRLVLATGSDEHVARRIAEHLGTFDDVVGSNGRDNLKGATKRDALVERFGNRGFDYAGDTAADLPVWSAARRAIVVGNDATLLAAAGRAATEASAIHTPRHELATVARALRVHQWPKNLLVFVPLLTAHRIGDLQAIASALLAFVAFCLAASAIYIVNDLVDLQSDRIHAGKRSRPFAAGDLGIGWGIAMLPLLSGGALGLAAIGGTGLLASVCAYVAAGILYCGLLKRVPVLDVLMIAGFFTLREIGGAFAVGVVFSDWLLAFSIAIFLSLALAKRHAELQRAAAAGLAPSTRLPGRGYRVGDGPGIAAAGMASGAIAIAILSLYITHPQVTVLYSHPGALWIVAAVMFAWLLRLWWLARAGRLGEDPLSFALRDTASYGAAALMLLALYLAT